MPEIKIDSKVLKSVQEALEPYADAMFAQRAGRWTAVVEFVHAERTEPGPDEAKAESVKLRVAAVEIAPDEYADERLRETLQDLYRRRTAAGTFDEIDDGVGGVRVGDLLRHGSGVLAGE